MTGLPPALIYLIGILFLPLLAGGARKAWTLFIGVVGLGLTLGLSPAVPEIVIRVLPGIDTVLLTV
ncbi:MAG TPA: hypothetical protein PK336_05330, partial [Methanoculleus sp.]|nr:hypothetical protein [Methanoculleus sp.]